MKKNILAAAAVTTTILASAAHGAITYVDGDFTSNTTLADGTAMNLVADETTAGAGNPEDYYITSGTVNTIPAAPDNWGERTRAGQNEDNILVGPQGAGDAAELRTRVSGLANGTYKVYAYHNNPGGWNIQAGTTTGSLTEYSTANSSLASLSTFTNTVLTASTGGGDLYESYLGNVVVSGGTLDVFIDDIATSTNRTWYEGVGYELVPEPGSLALLGLAGLGCLARRRRS